MTWRPLLLAILIAVLVAVAVLTFGYSMFRSDLLWIPIRDGVS